MKLDRVSLIQVTLSGIKVTFKYILRYKDVFKKRLTFLTAVHILTYIYDIYE
jgi:hypothetical protein